MDIARNEANFLGVLIKGGQSLTTVQRIGTALVGVLFLGLPLTMIAVFIAAAMKHEPIFDYNDGPLIVMLEVITIPLVILGVGYAAVRMLWNAFTAPRLR